jgi:colanic acid/amylovoran biosynthesis glycosyltransferase
VRIAFLPGVFPMLSETPVLNQVTGLVKRGHEVDIFGDRPRIDAPYHPSIDQFGLLKRARYRPDLPAGTVSRWRRSFEILRTLEGADRRALLRSMNVARFGTRAATGRLPLQTAQFLPVGHYDIIQAGFGEQGLKALRMKRIGAIHGKLITAFRGADISRHVASRGSAVYRRLFREGDLFLPVSRAFQARLETLGCPAEKIVVHRTGIDLASFPFTPSRPGPLLRLVSIGRLVEKKGLEDGLHALARLQAAGLNFHYTIVGDGPLRPGLESIAKGVGVAAEFTGSVEQHTIPARLAASDILLTPSVRASNGDEEGIPNVIKEAMALGRPVVSTRHSGIPELVEDGVTGFLAGERDPDGLARAIRHLAEHHEIWPAIQAAARRKVEQEYDIEKLNDRLVHHYKNVSGKQ